MELSYLYIFLLAVSLAMDAFAVSIATGIQIKENVLKNGLKISFSFGFFQAVMPLAGFFAASSFYDQICHIDHWIAFLLLFFIGGKMVYNSLKNDALCPSVKLKAGFKQLMILSFATSIDAFAAGISLSLICSEIFIPVLIIGVVTFVFSFAGSTFGSKLGCKFGNKMETAGGIILIILSIKILAEGLF
jgi:manganese efflux pump family protein